MNENFWNGFEKMAEDDHKGNPISVARSAAMGAMAGVIPLIVSELGTRAWTGRGASSYERKAALAEILAFASLGGSAAYIRKMSEKKKKKKE